MFEQGLNLVIEALQGFSDRSKIRARSGHLLQIAQLRGAVPVSYFRPDNLVATVVTGNISESTPGTPQAAGLTAESKPERQRAAPDLVAARLEDLRQTVSVCTKCPHLAASRHSVVFGVGNFQADLMFVGEAPGADEDLRGEPFVGRAGELLTRIIQTMGFQRSEVFIANVLKCRPDMPAGASGNRAPTPEEMETCLPYLRTQIELIRPRVMVALGGIAMRGLLGRTEPMKQMRGHWFSFGSIPVMATYHPSYLLRNQAISEKRKVWEDMLQVLERLEIPVTEKQRGYFLNG